MTWTLDNPILIADANNNNTSLRPTYDGKNLWVLQNDGTVSCIEFWGPYADLPNDATHTRYLAAEVDTNTLIGLGPAGRVLHNFQTNLTSITGFHHYEGYIYAMGTNAGANTIVRWPTTATSSANVTILCTTIACGSDMVCANGYVFFVDACPTTQTTTDYQNLCYIAISSMVGTNLIPGKTQIASAKQVATRHLVVSNNYVYVSSFNTSSVLQFNATPGFTLNATITVNRDVDRLFRVGNSVYVISSLKGTSSITVPGTITSIAGAALATPIATTSTSVFPTSMVSSIDLSNTVTELYGIMHIGTPITNTITLAADTNYTWFNTDCGGIQRTTNSNNHAITSAGMGLTGPDYTLLTTVSGMSVTGSTSSLSSSINITGITTVYITPPVTYNWFDGTSFNPINVPSYLFLISQTGITMVALPSVLKWATNLTLNQYTAVSSGGSSYKAG